MQKIINAIHAIQGIIIEIAYTLFIMLCAFILSLGLLTFLNK